MSIQKVCQVFDSITQQRAWSLQLIRINENEANDVAYITRELHLTPNDSLDRLISDIATECSPAKLQKKFDAVEDYDGTTNKRIIYKLEGDDVLVAENYCNLGVAISNPDAEVDPLEFGAQGYVLSGRVSIDNAVRDVRLIAVRSPIIVLKHKFRYANGEFSEITNKILSLKTVIDVAVIDDTVYFLSLEGEKLFCMERAYKTQSKLLIRKIIDKKIMSNESNFEKVASSRQFPRILVGYKAGRLELLGDKVKRKKICEMFGISLKDGLIDTTNIRNVERLIKFLCYRAMLDVDGNPVEVDGVRAWD